MYFTANPNGEAEVIKVTLKPNPRVRRIIFEEDFSNISIKGRQARGNILTKLPVHKIALKQRGGSTLGGRKVWFDRDVLRLNYDGRGEYLGEFQSDDSILVVHDNGDFYITNFDLSNHYEANIRILEKFDRTRYGPLCSTMQISRISRISNVSAWKQPTASRTIWERTRIIALFC